MNSLFFRKVLLNNFHKNLKDFSKQYATRKRFYRRTGILSNDGRYEITLDQRKLKTPLGKPFYSENESLAIAVATEWDAQKDTIQQSSMHLSSLCNTVLDNPNNLNKFDMVNYLINYITTDTLLFQSCEDDALYKMQKEKWDPVIQWFCDRFLINIKSTRGLVPPIVDQETQSILSKHLLSYNIAAVHGFTYGVDTLKSIILTLACVERFITPKEAVYLSRLEEEYQIGYWGRVEWAHVLSQHELEAKLSAAVLFVHFNTYRTSTVSKATNN